MKTVRTILKKILDFMFAAILSIFLVFIFMNIAYSKRKEMKQGFMSKLSALQILLGDLYQQGSSKALSYKDETSE